MASIEFINKRIEGKEKEIVKLQKKLARIEKAEATNWEVNPYWYSESDKKWCIRDISEAEKALANYKEMLQTEMEKSASRNVQVIIEFLENWKNKMRTYYADMFPQYLEARAEYWKKDHELVDKYEGLWKEFDRTTQRDAYMEARKAVRDEMKELRESFHETWSFMGVYVSYRDQFDSEKFEKDIKKEAERKYDDIIERTNEIVGEITDVANLHIGYKGDLEGYIIGTRGIAKVQTIGAGGYNIQCFHFRTLIHKMK